jgi:NTP pyrophosphatase (non-canonical NTP hydrolase)
MKNSNSNTKKTKLNLDFNALFPGKLYKIQDQEIEIKPVNVSQIAYIIKKIQSLIPLFQKNDISGDNFNSSSNLITLVSILFEHAPEILSEITQIEIESLQQLPLDIVIDIFAVAIEVNLESKDSLEKNYQSLKINIKKILPEIAEVV